MSNIWREKNEYDAKLAINIFRLLSYDSLTRVIAQQSHQNLLWISQATFLRIHVPLLWKKQLKLANCFISLCRAKTIFGVTRPNSLLHKTKFIFSPAIPELRKPILTNFPSAVYPCKQACLVILKGATLLTMSHSAPSGVTRHHNKWIVVRLRVCGLEWTWHLKLSAAISCWFKHLNVSTTTFSDQFMICDAMYFHGLFNAF
jgi:hypothetical protein